MTRSKNAIRVAGAIEWLSGVLVRALRLDLWRMGLIARCPDRFRRPLQSGGSPQGTSAR